jgi:hypothetical protein
MKAFLVSVALLALMCSKAHAQSPETPSRVFVVNTGDGTVSLVDLKAMKEVERYKVGPRPYGIAVSQDNKTVAVGVEDEERVKFYSLPDFKLKGETPVGKMFNDHIVLTKDGKHILIANFYSDDILAIDINTMKEAFRLENLSAPHVVRYGPQNKLAYVTCKKVSGVAAVDPEARKVVKFHQLTINPRSLTFSPDESKVYFGAHWTDGFFEADMKAGKVTRLFQLEPPKENAKPQEVTYHGVQAVHDNVVLAANEGRSYIDAVDVRTGELLDRLSDVSKPCCIEPIPGLGKGEKVRVLISNIGDDSLQLVEVAKDGKLKSLGRAMVGKAPKRVAFLHPKSPEKSGSLRSGLQVGKSIPGPFHPISVVNVEMPTRSGVRHDFTEQHGSNPVVMLFARRVSDPLTRLIQKLDVEVGKRKSAKLKAVVIMLGGDFDIERSLRKLAREQEIKNISFGVVEASGPRAYQLNREADLTAILYRRYKVEANHAFREGDWNDDAIDRVLGDISKIVPEEEAQLDADKIGRLAGAKPTTAPDGVIRIGWPRTDVKVTVDGLAFKPFAGLGSWAAFTPAKHGAMVMGDTIVFQDEVTPAMDAAFAHDLEVTALHNHFFYDEPKVYFMHIGGAGDAEKLAGGVKAVWDAIKRVRADSPQPATRFPGKVPAGGKVSPEPIAKILGHKAETQDGVVKVTIGRTGTMHGVKVGGSMGLTTWAAFSGTDDLAAVDGDFIMTAAEVQPVLRALRKADIHIVALHNHMVGEQPAFYFTHFWAKGPAEELARGLKTALDAQQAAGHRSKTARQ